MYKQSIIIAVCAASITFNANASDWQSNTNTVFDPQSQVCYDLDGPESIQITGVRLGVRPVVSASSGGITMHIMPEAEDFGQPGWAFSQDLTRIVMFDRGPFPNLRPRNCQTILKDLIYRVHDRNKGNPGKAKDEYQRFIDDLEKIEAHMPPGFEWWMPPGLLDASNLALRRTNSEILLRRARIDGCGIARGRLEDEIVLVDSPLSGLNIQMTSRLQQLLEEERETKAVLLLSHELDLQRDLGERVRDAIIEPVYHDLVLDIDAETGLPEPYHDVGLQRDLEETVRDAIIEPVHQDLVLIIDPETGLPKPCIHASNLAIADTVEREGENARDALHQRKLNLVQLQNEFWPSTDLHERLGEIIAVYTKALGDDSGPLQVQIEPENQIQEAELNETVFDLGIKFEFKGSPYGFLSNPRLANTQRTVEEIRHWGGFGVTKSIYDSNDVITRDDKISAFVGAQAILFAAENTGLQNIGGVTTPIGEGNSVKAGGIIFGGEYHPIPQIMLRGYGGVGLASNNYQLSQGGVVVASNNWLGPAFMAGFGIYYNYCSCFYVGATADYLYQPGDNVFLNNGVPLRRGSQSAWLFGISVIVPLAILTASTYD